MNLFTFRRRIWALVAFLAAGGLAVAGVGVATTLGTDADELLFCVKQQGQLRLVEDESECKKSERFVRFAPPAAGGGPLAFGVVKSTTSTGPSFFDPARSQNIASVSNAIGPLITGTHLRSLCVELVPAVKSQVSTVHVQRSSVGPGTSGGGPNATLWVDQDAFFQTATGCPATTDVVIGLGSDTFGSTFGSFYLLVH